jgi:fido (protein-threonine AMPylation protein)
MTEMMEYPDGARSLDPNELGDLKFKHITTREEIDDELEQANIESGLHWLARHRGNVLTDDLTLHKRLFGDVWDCGLTQRGLLRPEDRQ